MAALLALLACAAQAQEAGRLAFEECRACHALEPGRNGLPGPNLAGLVGRRVGADPDYDYSPVLRAARAAGQVWDAALLERFLADPEEMFPGMWMAARGLRDPAERAALVRFIVDPASR